MNADPDSSVAKPDPAELYKLQTQENPAQQNCVFIYGKIPLPWFGEIISIITVKNYLFLLINKELVVDKVVPFRDMVSAGSKRDIRGLFA